MTSPTYVSSSISGASDVFSTQTTIPKPAGTQAGDVVVLIVETDDTPRPTINWPAGFTQKVDYTFPSSSAGHNVKMAWLRSASGEGTGSYVPTWTGSSWAQGMAIAIRGCVASGDPFEDSQVSFDATGGPSESAVGITTTGADFLLFVCSHDSSDGTSDFTPPTGFTEVQDTNYLQLAYLEGSATGSVSVSGGTLTGTGTHAQFVLAALGASGGGSDFTQTSAEDRGLVDSTVLSTGKSLTEARGVTDFVSLDTVKVTTDQRGLVDVTGMMVSLVKDENRGMTDIVTGLPAPDDGLVFTRLVST